MFKDKVKYHRYS